MYLDLAWGCSTDPTCCLGDPQGAAPPEPGPRAGHAAWGLKRGCSAAVLEPGEQPLTGFRVRPRSAQPGSGAPGPTRRAPPGPRSLLRAGPCPLPGPLPAQSPGPAPPRAPPRAVPEPLARAPRPPISPAPARPPAWPRLRPEPGWPSGCTAAEGAASRGTVRPARRAWRRGAGRAGPRTGAGSGVAPAGNAGARSALTCALCPQVASAAAAAASPPGLARRPGRAARSPRGVRRAR